MSIKARKARAIRRASRLRSQHRDGLGVSELFLAGDADAAVIIMASDMRLKMYLLGFTEIPPQRSWQRCGQTPWNRDSAAVN